MIAANPGQVVEAHRAVAEQPSIDVRGLTKHYGTVEAIRGITIEVARGEIFGLIGPDGAGKTSTFQILAGVMEASSGSASVFSRPAREMRSQTGYLTQTFSLYPDLTVAENIRYSGDLRRIPPDEIAERGRQYLQMFDMDRFADRLAGKLSGGMKQKLALVSALVPQPRVLLLDEPTTGVDPVSRREFWDVLAHLTAQGLTILVATPYLDEAERCHRIALMYQGEIHQVGTPTQLRASLGAKRLELRTADLRKAERELSGKLGRIRKSSTSSGLATGSTCWSAIRKKTGHGWPKNWNARGCPPSKFVSMNRPSKTPSWPSCALWGKRQAQSSIPGGTTTATCAGKLPSARKPWSRNLANLPP